MNGLPTRSDLDREITIQRKIKAQGFIKTGQGAWEDVATGIRAQVQDMLPSRGERLADGLVIEAGPARIRIRYRPDITSDMRILYGSRIMEIMGRPAELGRRQWLEMMAQDFSTAGSAA